MNNYIRTQIQIQFYSNYHNKTSNDNINDFKVSRKDKANSYPSSYHKIAENQRKTAFKVFFSMSRVFPSLNESTKWKVRKGAEEKL